MPPSKVFNHIFQDFTGAGSVCTVQIKKKLRMVDTEQNNQSVVVLFQSKFSLPFGPTWFGMRGEFYTIIMWFRFDFFSPNRDIFCLKFQCFDSFESQLYAHSVGLLAFMMKDRRAVIQFSNVKNSWNLLAKKFMEKQFISADILMNLMFLVIDLTDSFELGAKSFMSNGFLRWWALFVTAISLNWNMLSNTVRTYLIEKLSKVSILGF